MLYRFLGGTDGGTPVGKLFIDPNGVIYGTTSVGGVPGVGQSGLGCGTVFSLIPPQGTMQKWTEKILYRFTGGADGCAPNGGVIADPNGVLYGTAASGGNGQGVVYKLVPPAGGQGWTFSAIYAFSGTGDGSRPQGELVRDAEGSLYGTTYEGGSLAGDCLSIGGCGTIYELTPPATANGQWAASILHEFGSAEGAGPSGLTEVNAGLYGVLGSGPSSPNGAVFQVFGVPLVQLAP